MSCRQETTNNVYYDAIIISVLLRVILPAPVVQSLWRVCGVSLTISLMVVLATMMCEIATMDLLLVMILIGIGMDVNLEYFLMRQVMLWMMMLLLLLQLPLLF